MYHSQSTLDDQTVHRFYSVELLSCLLLSYAYGIQKLQYDKSLTINEHVCKCQHKHISGRNEDSVVWALFVWHFTEGGPVGLHTKREECCENVNARKLRDQ